MTLDSLPDLDTSGLCLVKTLPTALTCWAYRSTALRDGARTSTLVPISARISPGALSPGARCDRSMRWADVYVCMLADGVALRNRCPQGQADPRAAIAGVSRTMRSLDAMGRRLRLHAGRRCCPPESLPSGAG